MEILATIINFALLIALIICPVFILNRLYKRNAKNTFLPYLIFGTLLTFLLIMLMAWWSQFSIELSLSYYGYDSDLLTETERFKNVAFENVDHVKKLEISRMGIGWPLKAIMFYPIYFTYLLIVYFSMYIFKKNKSKSR
jgi:hypothetical protein